MLSVNALPVAPVTANIAVCSVQLFLILQQQELLQMVQWLCTYFSRKRKFIGYRKTLAGTYTYYATQTINGCEDLKSFHTDNQHTPNRRELMKQYVGTCSKSYNNGR